MPAGVTKLSVARTDCHARFDHPILTIFLDVAAADRCVRRDVDPRASVVQNPSPMNLLNKLVCWLRSGSLPSSCGSHYAPVMQLLMLIYAVLLPVTWGWRIAAWGGIAARWETLLVTDMLVAIVSTLGILLVRKGKFRTAVISFVTALLIAQEIAAVTPGAQSQATVMRLIVPLAISGLVLGRCGLWPTFLGVVIVLASSSVVDTGLVIDPRVPALSGMGGLLSVGIVFLLITVLIDRTMKGKREGIDAWVDRGRQLQREMTERERAQAQLIHAQKLEATGRLATGIAHDFNNILDVIVGYATQRDRIVAMENRQGQEAAVTKVMTAIEAAAMRGAEITHKLLAFNRQDRARLEVFDAGQVIMEMQPMFRQLLSRSTNLVLPNSRHPFYVQLDRGEFELMILNIATNARDAMTDGGIFSINLTSESNRRVSITFSDTGHGMDENVQQRVFEPFFSTKSAAGGTGLGLAVVRDMVLAAGGEISVESAVGQGSTFRVLVPAADVSAATSALITH